MRRYGVVCVSCGEDALVAARENPPDLVLLDIELPDMDGFEIMAALRHGIVDEAVPVIFLTGREDSFSREKGLEAGAVDYIIKPYDRQELSIKVKNHLALYKARKEIERRNRSLAREIETASQLQNSLLPHYFPETDALHFAVYYKPVSRAGGDFYDVVTLDERTVAAAVVDVSGHGVASAMIGAMFKMCFHSFARTGMSPAELLFIINNEMVRILPESDFLTVFYCIIDIETLDMTYCNAGHPRPLLYRRDTGVINEPSEGGPLLGAFPNLEYENGVTRMQPGDKLLIFTDGVSEATRADNPNEFYGVERLREVFRRHVSLPPQETLDRIVESLMEFSDGEEFDDDISLMLISAERA